MELIMPNNSFREILICEKKIKYTSLNDISISFCIVDVNHCSYVDANNAFLSLFKYKPEKLFGMNLFNIVDKKYISQLKTYFKEAKRYNKVTPFNVVLFNGSSEYNQYKITTSVFSGRKRLLVCDYRLIS